MSGNCEPSSAPKTSGASNLIESNAMGFLPFVNQGEKRVVRWPRLVLMWLAIILAVLLGNGAMSYALTGDFWYYTLFGAGLGVFAAAMATGLGFRLPVEKLPRIR